MHSPRPLCPRAPFVTRSLLCPRSRLLLFCTVTRCWFVVPYWCTRARSCGCCQQPFSGVYAVVHTLLCFWLFSRSCMPRCGVAFLVPRLVHEPFCASAACPCLAPFLPAGESPPRSGVVFPSQALPTVDSVRLLHALVLLGVLARGHWPCMLVATGLLCSASRCRCFLGLLTRWRCPRSFPPPLPFSPLRASWQFQQCILYVCKRFMNFGGVFSWHDFGYYLAVAQQHAVHSGPTAERSLSLPSGAASASCGVATTLT